LESRFSDMPLNVAALPVEARGYPVPWFTPWINGLPEFRAVDPSRIREADQKGLCWICGRKLGGRKAFVIGPMCAVNRISVEPPSHLECARFAVVACPFLSRPLAKRAPTDDLPHSSPPGVMIERNPGVTLIWLTQTYRSVKQPEGGLLFRIGTPLQTEWYAQGRTATRAEILESIETGLPELARYARQEGRDSLAALRLAVERAVKLVPAE
jgi:hypothetical protein